MTHESRDLAIIEGEITIITERLDALTAAHAKYQAAHAKAYQEADPVTLLKAEAQMNAHMAAIRSLQEQQTTLEHEADPQRYAQHVQALWAALDALQTDGLATIERLAAALIPALVQFRESLQVERERLQAQYEVVQELARQRPLQLDDMAYKDILLRDHMSRMMSMQGAAELHAREQAQIPPAGPTPPFYNIANCPPGTPEPPQDLWKLAGLRH